MSELLSREKEFRKLNEQLDQLANASLELNQQLTPQQQSQQDQTHQHQIQVPTPQQQSPPDQQHQQQPQQQSQPPQQLQQLPQHQQQHPQQQHPHQQPQHPHQQSQQQPQQRSPNPSQQLQNLQQKNGHQPTIDRSTRPKTESKCLTYTKNNNHSATMKKRGAGDAASEHTYSNVLPPPPPLQTPRTNTADRPTNSLIRGNEKEGLNRYKTTTLNTATTAATMNSGRMSQRGASIAERSIQATAPQRESPIPNNMKTPSQKSPQHITNRNSKLPDSSRTSSRMSYRSSNASHTGGPFTVRYRNPKFVESPSLEVLVKDEVASVRRQQPLGMTYSHNGTDVESLVSATASKTGDIDGKSSRKSQGSARKHISTEGLIKFLKSKIVILEEDHDHISKEMLQQKELLEKTLERQKKLEQQRDQAFAKQNSLSEQLAKTELKLEEANRRVKERTTEQMNQQKEVEIVRREIKVFTQTNTNLEKRLLRANEELESAKNALAAMRETERDLRETIRAESESKEKQIKSLRKQRADLLNAYKKQLFLIDNLKRQTLCLEQAKMIDFNEKEFSKVLEWNSKT